MRLFRQRRVPAFPFDELAQYNAERSRGVKHTPEMEARMEREQAEFNRWSGMTTAEREHYVKPAMLEFKTAGIERDHVQEVIDHIAHLDDWQIAAIRDEINTWRTDDDSQSKTTEDDGKDGRGVSGRRSCDAHRGEL